MGLLFSCSLWMSQHPCAHFFHVWTGAKAGSGAVLSQGLPFLLLLQPDSFRCHNPMFVKHCHGSELNVTDTASWSESGRRIKRGELLFIYRHYRNQQRWEHTWKALTRYLIHHFGILQWVLRAAGELPSCSPDSPCSSFPGSLWKSEKTTDSNPHKSHQAWLSSSDRGRRWEQEGNVLLDSWLPCFMYLALRGLFQFGELADCDRNTFLSFVINIDG